MRFSRSRPQCSFSNLSVIRSVVTTHSVKRLGDRGLGVRNTVIPDRFRIRLARRLPAVRAPQHLRSAGERQDQFAYLIILGEF